MPPKKGVKKAGKKKGKGKKHAKSKLKTEAKPAKSAENGAVGNSGTESNANADIEKPPPLIRQISADFKNAFTTDSRTANKNPKMKSLLKYSKFLVFGSRLNLSQVEDVPNKSTGFDEGGVSKAGTPVSRKQSLVRRQSSLGFDSKTFPLAFESKKRDAVKIIDISRETTFQDVCRLLKSSDAKECSSVWFLEFPEDRMSDNVKFNLILSEKDWQKALSEFHFSRRSMRLKALEDFLRLAIEGTQTESVSNRLEAFQRCTEICAYEDLHSQLPVSTLEAACTAILESDSIDLKNSASHFLWCAVSFSSEFRSYLETSGLLASIVKNSSLFYSMESLAGDEFVLKQNIAGVLALLTYYSHQSTAQILQHDPNLLCLKVLSKGGQTSAKFERITFILSLQIALECCEVDAARAIEGIYNSRIFDTIFRASKQNDTDMIWQTQLKILALMTFSVETLIDKWDCENIISRLLDYSDKTLAMIQENPYATESSQCVSCVAACLWAISSAGVEIDTASSKIILNLLETIDSNTSAAEIIAGATGSIVYSNQSIIEEHPEIVSTLLHVLQNSESGKVSSTANAILRVASALPSSVLELNGLQVLCDSISTSSFEIGERTQVSNILMVLGYHTYLWAWNHENIDAIVGFLQHCISKPLAPASRYGAYTSILALWCLGRNEKHREILATSTTFDCVVKASEMFGEDYLDLQKASVALLWTLAYDTNGRKLSKDSTVLEYLIGLLCSAPQMEGNVVQVIKTASRNSLRQSRSRIKQTKNSSTSSKRRLKPIQRPRSAAPTRLRQNASETKEISEEEKMENSLRETLRDTAGRGGSSRRRNRRPKSAAPSRKRGANLSIMKQLSPKGAASRKTFDEIASPLSRSTKITPTHTIPAHDPSYLDPRCGIWQMVLSALWMFQEEQSNMPKLRDLNLAQILLRICLSSSVTVSPEIRVLASTMSQALSRKLQMMPKELVASTNVEEKLSGKDDVNVDSETKEHKEENNESDEKMNEKSETNHEATKINEDNVNKDPGKGGNQNIDASEAKNVNEMNHQYTQDLECIMRPDFPEMLVITLLLISKCKDIRVYAAKSFAHLAMGSTMKTLAKHLGIFEILLGFCENNPYDTLAKYSMQAVLNLSTLKSNQLYLGQNGFNRIMSLSTLDVPKCATQKYARQTIVNLSKHPSNRTKIYKQELRLKALYAHGKLKPCRDPEFVKRYRSFHSPVKSESRPKSPDADIRNRFDEWYGNMFDKKNDNLAMSRTKVSESSIPLIRPESPGFKMDWSLSRRSDASQANYVTDPTVNTDLSHQMRSPLKSMFKKRGKIHRAKSIPLLRPNSAPSLKKKRFRSNNNLGNTGNRWEPAVHHFENLHIERDPKLPPSSVSPVKVVLDPAVGSNNEIVFSNNASPSQKFHSRLVKWEMVPGNRISDAINLKTYDLPSGEKVHFYENKMGLYDDDPGPEEPPKLPMMLQDIFIQKLPGITGAPVYETSFLAEELNVLPAHAHHPRSDHVSKVYRDSLENYVFFQYSNDDSTESTEDKGVQEPQSHKIKKKDWSLFELRKYENDDGSMLDGEHSQNCAFEIDWERCTMKRSFWSFCCGEYPPGPFRVGDIVEAQQKRTGKWKKATVTKVRGHEGTVDVVLGDDPANRLNRQRKMPYFKVRFEGGKPGGKDIMGENVANAPAETTLSIPVKSLPDIVGFEDHLLTRIRSFSNVKSIDVKNKGGDDSATISFTGTQNSVNMATALVKQAMNVGRAKQSMKKYFREALMAFNFFKAAGGADIFSMQINEFLQFADQSGIDKHVTHAELSILFDVVNDELTKTWVAKKEGIIFDSNVNDDRALMRFEWQECLTRLALLLYKKTKNKDANWVDLPDAIEHMHVNYIHKNLGTNVILHSDHFRSKRMYFDEVEEVLSMNWELLVDMFTIVAGSDPTIMPNSRHAKRKSQRQMLVSMSEWLMFLKTVGFIDEDFTRREATFSFLWSKFTVMDDFSNPERAQMLTFFDFIEAICRVTDMKTVPTTEQLEHAGALDIVSYYNLKSNGPGMRKQASILNFSDSNKRKRNELESVTVVNEGEEIDCRLLSYKLKLMLKLFKSRMQNMKKFKRTNILEQKRILWDKALEEHEHSIYCDLHWTFEEGHVMAGKKKKVVNLHSSAGRAPNVLVFRSNESKKALTLDTQVDASERMLM